MQPSIRPRALLALFSCIPALGHAQDDRGRLARQNSRVLEMRTAQSAAQSITESESDDSRARAWGLQAKEWTRYRQLMAGPLGIYSPNLDPLTALGIEARSDAERRHYAALQVRMEGRRVEKLLAYQRAYDEAWRQLYPTLEPLARSAVASRSDRDAGTSSDPQRLAVFVKENCGACDARVAALQAAGRAMDIYVVGSLQDDARVRRWAAHAGIDPAKVRSHRITLNHDAGRWLSLGRQDSLPAVLEEASGPWRRE